MNDAITWDLVTRGLAILGAALGVFNLVVSYRQSTPRYRVRGSVDKSTASYKLLIVVQNNGLHPITVERFWLTRYAQSGDHPRKVGLAVEEADKLPQTIEMGRAATFSCSIEAIQQSIDSGNDVVGVGTSDGRSKQSLRIKDLARLARSTR